jgi:hypothetical protein
MTALIGGSVRRPSSYETMIRGGRGPLSFLIHFLTLDSQLSFDKNTCSNVISRFDEHQNGRDKYQIMYLLLEFYRRKGLGI